MHASTTKAPLRPLRSGPRVDGPPRSRARTRHLLALVGLACLAPAAAQERSAAAGPGAKPAPADGVVVPVHESDRGGGVWGGGATYKASFDGGFRFVPYLGGLVEENRWLRWRTTDVRRGPDPLHWVDPSPAMRVLRDGTRVEYHHAGGALVEAYDLGVDGCEQTFVLARRPAGRGDLILRGRVETALRVLPPGRAVFAHADIVFGEEDGTPRIGYGRATVVDGRGIRLAVESRVDAPADVRGARALEIRVPGDWLATATYPVTIDPVINRQMIGDAGSNAAAVVLGLDVAVSYGGGHRAYAITRAASRRDLDCWLIVEDTRSGARRNGFADLSLTRSGSGLRVAYVLGTDSFVGAYQRTVSGRSSEIGFFVLPAGSTTQPPVYLWPNPSGTFDSRPDVGGNHDRRDTRFLLLMQEDRGTAPGDTDSSRIEAAVLDTTRPNGVPRSVTVPTSPSRDQDHPRASTAVADAAGTWGVTWQEYNTRSTTAGWDLRVLTVDAGGTASPVWNAPYATTLRHGLRPQIDGQGGRFALAFASRSAVGVGKIPDPEGERIELARFRVDRAGSFVSEGSEVGVSRTSVSLRAGSLAYDFVSGGFWCVGFDDAARRACYVARFGEGGVVQDEQRANNLGAVSSQVAVALDRRRHTWRCTWTEAGSSPQLHQVWSGELENPLEETRLYGVGCSTALPEARFPWAGNGNFRLVLDGAPPSTAAALLLGALPGSLPLDGIRMPGCVLNLDPVGIVDSLSTRTDLLGRAEVPIPLPPTLRVRVYLQWSHLAPRANRLGVQTAQGLRISIR